MAKVAGEFDAPNSSRDLTASTCVLRYLAIVMQKSYADAVWDGLRVVDSGLSPAKECNDRRSLTPRLGIVEAPPALPRYSSSCTMTMTVAVNQ